MDGRKACLLVQSKTMLAWGYVFLAACELLTKQNG